MKFKPVKTKNLITIIGGLVLASIFLSLTLNNTNITLAYSPQTTHPDLTREIIDFYELSGGKKLADEQKQWIIQGSIDEDKAPRWLNHFYDPVFGRGLDDTSVFSIYGIAGYPAKKWAQFSSYQSINPENVANMWTGKGPVVSGSWWGDFSYEAAVKNYSENKEKEAYVSLGHILHLIEDMTVPEHTRNDAHPGSDMPSFYENWTKNNSSSLTQNLGKRLFVKGNKPVIYSDLESYFNNLATYTNNHFFSPRTINSEIYLKPKIVYEDGTFAYGRDENGELFDLAYIEKNFATKQVVYNVKKEQILQEYWLRLSRQAVVNGAGVIQLFLNQAEIAKGKQSKPKSSLISQILNFFRSPSAPKNEPALVIKSEPRHDVGTQPAKPAAVQKPAPAQPKPTPISTLPTPNVGTPTSPQASVGAAPAPAPAPQTSAPIVYGGGGGGGGGSSSSNTTQQTTQQNSTQENVEISTFQAGDLVINEIMYDLEGSDGIGSDSHAHEWIELYNKSANTITLTGGNDGWKFSDGSNHMLNEPPTNGSQGSMTIPAGGYAVLSGNAVIFLADHSGFNGTVIDTVMSLKNSTSTVKIITPDGAVIDEVTYYSSWGANGNGKTLERKSDGNWGVSSAVGGTPGAANNWLLTTSDVVDDSATSTPETATSSPLFLGLGTDVAATTTITANTTWTLAGSPYRLFFDGQRRPTVAAGAVLTIEPGVKIIPQGGNYTALEIQGTLNAIATSGAPIIFTSINDGDGLASTTPYAGEWLNIAFSQGSQANLDYVEFRYGGQGNTLPLYEMVNIVSATVNIKNSKFENSQNTALHLTDSSGIVENSVFSGNNCGISVDSLNGIATASYAGCYGTHTSGQILSAAPQIKNNQFIRNQLIGIEVRSGAAPAIDSNIFTDNGYPIKIESSYPSIANSQINNSTTSPNILKGIAISGYTHFSQNFTLKNNPQLPYILETNGPSPYIDSGATLTIEPGAIFKIGHTFTALNVNGALIASTTPDNPIVFTSFKDDTRGGDTNGDGLASAPANNDWANIKFLTGSIGNFANAIFSYGGFGYVAPPPTAPTELAIENFDSYSAGVLSGQGDWGGGNPSSEISVVNSFAHDGANSVSLSSGGGGAYAYRTLTQPITASGTLSFWLYYNSLGNQGVSFANSTGNLVANIYYDSNNNCSTSDGSCWALMGDGGIGHFTRTNIQTTVNSWHFIELEISFSNQEVRMRQDVGEWSNWVGSNRTNLGRIRFDRGTGDVFYDTFIYHLLAQTSPQNSALSIDSGATVIVQ